MQIKEYQQNIIDLGAEPNNPDPIKSLLKEIENPISLAHSNS